MQSDITAGLELDIPERGLDLAELVFDVAQECDTSHTIRHSLDFSDFADKILIELLTFKVRHENSHLPEAQVQEMVDALVAEHNQEKEALAAEKAAKREKVKQFIHGDAVEGYELAFSICKGDESNEAKALAYRLMRHLKNLSIEEKLEISHLYVESLIDLGKKGNEVADIYCEMGRLACPQNKRGDYSLSLSFFEKAYEYIDERTWRLNEIVAFCNKFALHELRERCEQKKAYLQSLPPKTIEDLLSENI